MGLSTRVRQMFILIQTLWSLFRTRSELVLENALLRHQLGILGRKPKRLVLNRWDRALFMWLTKLVSNWRELLVIVQPETIIRWHRKGFSLWWGWNAYVERVIGSIRRECTDHFIVFGERHLARILRSYQNYYNRSRTHLSLNKDSPVPRPQRDVGRIRRTPKVGGLHYEFQRDAA